MAYGFYFNGSEIPITPGSVKFNYEGNNKTYTLIDDGEINVLKLPGLQEITFDILLPTHEYPFANNSETSPSTWLDMFEAWQTNKTPFQFVITRTTDAGDAYHGTSIRCAIETWNTEENAGDYGTDVNVSMTLKQYKDYGTKTVTLPKAREQDNAPTTPATVDAAKADNPVVMSKVMTNTSGNAAAVSKENSYGGVTSEGSYVLDYPDTRQEKLSRVTPSSSSSSSTSKYSAAAKENAQTWLNGGKVTVPSFGSNTSTKRFTFTQPASAKKTTVSSGDFLANAIANRDTSRKVSSSAMTFERIK